MGSFCQITTFICRSPALFSTVEKREKRALLSGGAKSHGIPRIRQACLSKNLDAGFNESMT
jgi:hypothetical protein